jgi:hypothetical protein
VLFAEATNNWTPANLSAFEESGLAAAWVDYTDMHRPGWISNLATVDKADNTTVGGPELLFPLADRLTRGMNSSKSGAIRMHVEYLKTYHGAGEADVTVCGSESVGTIVAMTDLQNTDKRNAQNHVSIAQFWSYKLKPADVERCSLLPPAQQNVGIRVMNRWLYRTEDTRQQNRKVKIFKVWMCFVD